MTRQKSFKRRVRERMAKTGESYTAARRMLIAAGARPDTPIACLVARVSDEALATATGRDWQGWIAELDGADAARRSHAEIARWLVAEHGVTGWWAQTITVGYEQARGLRAPGQRADGFAVSATKTIAASIERLFHAIADSTLREQWLPGAELHERTTIPPRSARYDWEDGETRVVIACTSLAPGKAQISVSHERLPDADSAEAMKAYWRERLVALKPLLEDAP